MIECVRGTRDILPGEIAAWHLVERTCADWFRRFGYEEIRLPVFEVTELFARGIGDATDIVEKEMYTFTDRNDQSLTLRPEGTASVVRACIQHGLLQDGAVRKLYYAGPMFRYEKPQKGRYRQFYQIGAEVLGSDSPAVEAETLDLLFRILQELEMAADARLVVNSIGCPACRPGFLSALQEAAGAARGAFCPDCQRRADSNPLRVLDCKNPACQPVIDRLPQVDASWCADCRRHHDSFRRYLTRLGVPFEENPRLVRGLDYYVRTTFEITSGSLGAQNALLGGGRYDGLVANLGGPPTPGFGFALGLDRFVLALPDEVRQRLAAPPTVYLAPVGAGTFEAALSLAAALRRAGLAAHLDYQERSFKSHLRQANRIGAPFAALLGEAEVARGTTALKDMVAGTQEEVPLDRLAEILTGRAGTQGVTPCP